MIRGIIAILLLVVSNMLMTIAWYGQVMFKSKIERFSLIAVIVLSWMIAFFEYLAMVPANRLGSVEYGGPFSIWQLKILQEAISLTVFAVLVQIVMKNEAIRWNHIVGFIFLLLAVFFIFKK
ncbi:MAG: DMT family protein [Alistipes sp.]|nr:DMT family protein [Candidatus Alistipes equi]